MGIIQLFCLFVVVFYIKTTYLHIVFTFTTIPESITPLQERHPEPGSIQLVVSCRCDLAVGGGGGFCFLLTLMASFSGPGRTGLGLWSSALLLLVVTELSGPVNAVSEPGKWILNIDSVSSVSVAVTVDFNMSERRIMKLPICFYVVSCGLCPLTQLHLPEMPFLGHACSASDKCKQR